MTKANRWLLPDGVDEILPPQASQLETLRRDILDLYSTWGYELVMTPLIEFLMCCKGKPPPVYAMPIACCIRGRKACWAHVAL